MTINTLLAAPAILHSTHSGMGTIIFPGGIAFRVWAPFAAGVSVIGDFNHWIESVNPLVAEGNGYWSVDVPQAKIGDEYQFVIHTETENLHRINPYASQVINSVRNAIIHDPNFDWTGDNFTMPPWNELVIYELHIGTFNDPEPIHPGTFEETAQKFPYLREIGINAVEIMPVGEFSMDVSWGYNPAHPFAVESALGGPQSLYKFVKAAHAHGIAVILDVVYNHFGPSDLDHSLWRFDGWSDPDHIGGIYFYDNERAVTPWGNTRPDYGRAEVRWYIRDNALFWLNKYRIDGLRFDSVVNIRNRTGNSKDPSTDLPEGWGLLQWVNDDIRTSQPWKITIAEDLQDDEWITKGTNVGGAGFGSQWDAKFVDSIRVAIVAANDGDRDLLAVRDALCHKYNNDAMQRVIYTESHDHVAKEHARVPEEIWPGHANSWFSRKRSTLGAAMVFTAPGIPMIFQGQEFLESGRFEDIMPLDWTKLDTYSGINLLYRDLIRLRRNWFDHTRGLRGQHINVFHTNNIDKMIAFHRWDSGGAGDDVVVVANFANRSYDSYRLGFPRGGRWQVRFNSDWQGYSGDFGNHAGYPIVANDGSYDGMSFYSDVGIGPYSVLILSQDSA